MARDPLEALVRLRRMTADEARRMLAECLKAERDADEAIAAIEEAIQQEMEAASNLAAGDAEVEAFAAWLHRIRPQQRAAQAGRDQAETETVRARAVLASARAAVQAAEEMLESRVVARRADAERQVQREIDEAALRGGV